jgi:hypothetical protein
MLVSPVIQHRLRVRQVDFSMSWAPLSHSPTSLYAVSIWMRHIAQKPSMNAIPLDIRDLVHCCPVSGVLEHQADLTPGIPVVVATRDGSARLTKAVQTA